jgi:hypothetical protein
LIALLAAGTSLLLTMLTSRLLRIGLLAIQYGAVAWLTGLSLPLQVAAVKLVAGLIACGILGINESQRDRGDRPAAGREFGSVFRLTAAAVALVTAFGLSRRNWFEVPDLSPLALQAATVLLAMGLLQLGLSGSTFRVCLGLLTLLSGFEIVYAVIEPSLAVLALLGSLHIGIALLAGYLDLVSPTQEALR